MIPRLVAFDLDDTLAPSKSPLESPMVDALTRLLDETEVCIISGGHFGQFSAQVLGRLSEAASARFDRLHLMPTCGTQYVRFEAGEWREQYSETLTDEEKAGAMASLERRARELGFWEAETWGPVLEDRGSQVTFSALGQAAPITAKARWDPAGDKKAALREAVAADLPELEVRSGGSTSIDITRRGVDKAYGMRKLVDATGIPLDDMLFVGDRLDPGGNDYPVRALGVRCIAVETWTQTVDVIDDMIGAVAA